MAENAQQQDPPRPRVKPPKPPFFEPGPNSDAATWLYRMQKYLELTREPLDTWVEWAVTFFDNQATKWWRNLVDPPVDWDEFGERFLQAFRPVNLIRNARHRLYDLKQTGSVYQYIRAFREICLDIPDLSEPERLHNFTRGLKQAVRVRVELQQPRNIEEAESIAALADDIVWNSRQRNFQFRYNSHVPTQGIRTNYQHGGPVPMEIDAMEEQEVIYEEDDPAELLQMMQGQKNIQGQLTDTLRARLLREGRCFYCREVGHLALNCPKKHQAREKNEKGKGSSN
jgi:hypothetical protein